MVQIGLLNFTLFPDHPEFYATYELLNVKDHTLYSDKLRLCVLDLTRIDLATQEDRFYQIDYWAALFQAATWEELNMLAQDNEYINEASETVYHLSQEEQIRQQCEAREDYYRRQLGIQKMMEEQEEQMREQEKTIKMLSLEKEAWTVEKEALYAELAALRAKVSERGDQK